MFKFFLFLRHRDVESDILTAGTYTEEGAAIWKTFKDKTYSRSLVGVRKLREAAQNRLLAERRTAGYEAAYHCAQVSTSRYTSTRVKASSLQVSILSQAVLSIRNNFSPLHINQRMTVKSTQPPSQKLRGRYPQINKLTIHFLIVPSLTNSDSLNLTLPHSFFGGTFYHSELQVCSRPTVRRVFGRRYLDVHLINN